MVPSIERLSGFDKEELFSSFFDRKRLRNLSDYDILFKIIFMFQTQNERRAVP